MQHFLRKWLAQSETEKRQLDAASPGTDCIGNVSKLSNLNVCEDMSDIFKIYYENLLC